MDESTEEAELQPTNPNVELTASVETTADISSTEVEAVATIAPESATPMEINEPIPETIPTTTVITEPPVEAETVAEQKIAESVEATVVAASVKASAPANPKSHPALPRPPSQATQRPVFHIIAPRAGGAEITPRTYRPRQFISKGGIDPRPSILRAYEPRRYIRIDKPPMAVQRPRKTAPSVINILQSAATSKIPIRAPQKPVNIHQLSSAPSVSRPPKPATSAPPPSGSTVTLLHPPTVSGKPGRGPRKTKQDPPTERRSEEPEKKRKRSTVDAESAPGSEEHETASESDPNRNIRQRDALEYLDEVKRRFDPVTYHTFLEVMKGFKMKK